MSNINKMRTILIVGYGYHTKKNIIPSLSKINFIKTYVLTKNNVFEYKNQKLNLIKKDVKNYDIIWISTPTKYHLKTFNEINKNYSFKNLIIEKPINIPKIKFLEKNVHEGSMFIHHPVWSQIINEINKNKFKNIEISFSVPNIHSGFQKDNKINLRNLFLELGYYPISAAFLLFPELKTSDISMISKTKTTMTLYIKKYMVKMFFGKCEYHNFLKIINQNNEIKYEYIFSKPEKKSIITKTRIFPKKMSIRNSKIFDHFKGQLESILKGNDKYLKDHLAIQFQKTFRYLKKNYDF